MSPTHTGGLHLGNIFLHKEQVVVSGLATFIGGLSGRVRSRAVRVKVTLVELDTRLRKDFTVKNLC